jgi:hypothetical protein
MSDDEINKLEELLIAATGLPVVEHPKPENYEDSIHIYADGVLTRSVCAPKGMDRDIVMRQTNFQAPAGGDLKWVISDDAKFRTGEPMPCPCEVDKDRQHWLLHC